MKKLLSIFILVNISTILCLEDKSELLKGKIISSDSSSNILNYAFDGNAQTEFKSSDKSNGWIGLELENANRITKIGWIPSNNSKDYLLGVFEGANNESFVDAFPLYMITEEGNPGVMNYIDIDMTYAFKYLRYVGPNGKYSVVSGIEFYGYESSTTITKEEEKLYQPTNLPLVVIHTDNGYDPVNKDNDISCNIAIVDKGKVDTKKRGSIRLRGNTTLSLQKKPYKFKFEEKTKLLDLPSKAKKWNLLANQFDKSLLRNTIALKMSQLFGMKYTVSCTPVDVMLNGEFKGNYLLCDKVEVSKTRIEFPEIPDSTIGGYLFEVGRETISSSKTTHGIPFEIIDPDYFDRTEEQKKYLEDAFDKIESEGYEGIVDKIDFDSFCKYILIGEFCSDPDAFFSVYITKPLKDDKIYFGPVWDFDLGFGNDHRTYSHIYEETLLLKYCGTAGTMKEFAIKLLNNEALLQHLKDTWTKYTTTVMTKEKLMNIIDEEVSKIYESQKLNFKRWNILNKMIWYAALAKCTYDAEVDFLKEYISVRFDIIGRVLEKIDTMNINEINEVTLSSNPENFDLILHSNNPNGNDPWDGFEDNASSINRSCQNEVQ